MNRLTTETSISCYDVLDQISYDVYGNITHEPTYPEGKPDMRLQCAATRYYDPTPGQWTCQEPIGFNAGSDNLYQYAANDPIAPLTDTSDTASVH